MINQVRFQCLIEPGLIKPISRIVNGTEPSTGLRLFHIQLVELHEETKGRDGVYRFQAESLFPKSLPNSGLERR